MFALNENYQKQVSKKIATAATPYTGKMIHSMLQPLNSAHDAVPDSPAMQLKKLPITFIGDSLFDDAQNVFASLKRNFTFDT